MSKIEIDYPRNEFLKELKTYIEEGNKLSKSFQARIPTQIQLEKLERELKFWNEEVQEFLKIRLHSIISTNEYLNDFKNVNLVDWNPAIKALAGQQINQTQSKYQHLLTCIQKKNDVLVLLERKSKFMDVVEYYQDIVIENPEIKMKEIFISHSSLDAKYVEKIIDILEIIGVPSEKIFCSSFEGYGVRLGNDFLQDIRKRLNSQVLVVFVLSENFYSSVVSLCEMGATWVKTNSHIPVLIPPFDYKDVKGVIPTTNGMKINEKPKYNSLKTIVEEFLDLEPINNSVWERKRDNLLKELKLLLENTSNSNEQVANTKTKKLKENLNLSFYDNVDGKIKRKSEEEWPDDFEMQLDYINRHKSAVQKLKNHNPIDIDEDKFKVIREKGRREWKDDFEMQLDYVKRQVESLRRLNER
ncbi:toll/interleukin-1 receptor domain-containing protein [Psychroserpens damuponensis]|uniref:toll/interleukin-1 receptor domain-containing protein n=1 Tax=Psychroserpens damuponensis TaxID=943936 RepID=UPI00058B61EF|nr:toll/interleukin-1 receptor domain-containing protein [Psychroserpens damuponensis]